MGYTVSRAIVQRNLDQIEQLLNAKKTLVFEHPYPERLAAKLRESLNATQHFEEFKHLYKVKQMYQFKVRRGKVIAEYQHPVGVIEAEEESPSETVPTGKPLPPESKVLPEVMNLLELLTAALKFDSAGEINFPNVEMTPEDKIRLYEWASTREWKIIDHDDAGVTITKNQIPKEIEWRPQEGSLSG